MTPGVTPETLDGMSKDVLKEISNRLSDESFQFNPGRRIIIPKASGGTRPLTFKGREKKSSISPENDSRSSFRSYIFWFKSWL
jgi:hypothetical protein